MKPYTVTYYLSDEAEKRLKAIQAGYNATGGSFNDLQDLFNAIMITKSDEHINDRLLYAEWQTYLITDKEYSDRLKEGEKAL